MSSKKVYNLHCKNCGQLVSPRGLKTTLIVDRSVLCYSSDYGTNQILDINMPHKF
jgi:hypothetical protein